MRKYLIVMLILVFVISICVGCSVKSAQSGIKKNELSIKETKSDMDEETSLDMSTEKNTEFCDVIINTEYIPVEYRQNALIVQRSDKIKLYGLLDNKGNIVLEPEYDSLTFTLMNGKDFIKATLATDLGILYLDGKEYIEMGKYEDIVSAGDIGWLALENGKQYLLDEEGKVTTELGDIYNFCIGNKYLFKSSSVSKMMEGQGAKSCKMNQLGGDIYDLNESILISAESMNIIYYDWLVDGNMFEVTMLEGNKGIPTLIDTNGNIIAKMGDDPNNYIVDVIMDKQKIIFRNSLIPNSGLFEFDLSSKSIIETVYPNETLWDAQIIVKKTGEFYQLYKYEQLLIDERFVTYSFNDGVIWLENIDSEWGIIDYDGNIIIPFGEIGLRDSFYQDGNLPFLRSSGMFGFYTINSGNYEFHNYVIAKGRLCKSN